ncbi:MAG: 3'(2'),5'-bisphosphate nucleotidase CysQ [Bacteroidetes bacterium]|nr:3'(2'),5'-bisphosphate nucleotidase CysQ [Bacteroidota bacterium]
MKEHYLGAIIVALEAGKSIKKIYHSDYIIENKEDHSPLTTADKKSHQIITKKLESLGYPILSEEGKILDYSEREVWKKFWMVDPLDGTKEFIKENGEFTVNIAWIENNKSQFGVIYAPILDILYYGILEEGAYRIENASKKLCIVNSESLLLSSESLPIFNDRTSLTVVASRSHGSEETEQFIQFARSNNKTVETISRGSSLKLCMIAEGIADVYPRFGLTSEWDIAAGHAIINAAGGKILNVNNLQKELVYNKMDILNPYFIAIINKSQEPLINEYSKFLKT